MAKLICVQFNPVGGIRQCQWANEWALAARAVATTIDAPPKYALNVPSSLLLLSLILTHVRVDSFVGVSVGDLEDWLVNKDQYKPTRSEGWQSFQAVETTLYSTLPALCNPGLLIEVSAICAFDAKQTLRLVPPLASSTHSVTSKSIAEAIARWLLLTPGGRVIVFIDEANFFPAILGMAPVEEQADMYVY